MIRRLRVDFAPRRRAGVWLGGSILLAGLAAAVLTAEHYQALGERRDRLESVLQASTKGKPARRSAGEAPASQEAAQRRSAARRGIVRALGRPWDELFGDIEAASHEHVALLAIEPDVRRAEVRLAGEARDARALAEYMTVLERTPMLERVNLAQHETVTDGGGPVLRFVVAGTWVGAR